VSPKAPLTPFVLVTLTRPDGQRRDWTHLARPDEFAAAEHTCDVTIGENTFRRVAEGYQIRVQIDDLSATFTLRAEVPPWRPETGHAFFGEREEHYIAWLPVVARGAVEAVLSLGGGVERLTGTGYHDHNWGNVAPRKVLDHWYWGRARIGDYTAVTLMFVAHATYGKAVLPAVMIAEHGDIVASAVGRRRVAFAGTDVVPHGETGVPVQRCLEYRVHEADSSFTVTFVHERDVSTLDFGAAGAYLRFMGDVAIEHRRGAETTTASGRTLWELLYFGDRRALDPPLPHPTVLIGHQA
jgi:hypothetical protein